MSACGYKRTYSGHSIVFQALSHIWVLGDTTALPAIADERGFTGARCVLPTGDVVELRGPDGSLVARGIVSCDAPTAQKWCDGQAPIDIRNHDALVHRDHLVLEP